MDLIFSYYSKYPYQKVKEHSKLELKTLGITLLICKQTSNSYKSKTILKYLRMLSFNPSLQILEEEFLEVCKLLPASSSKWIRMLSQLQNKDLESFQALIESSEIQIIAKQLKHISKSYDEK